MITETFIKSLAVRAAVASLKDSSPYAWGGESGDSRPSNRHPAGGSPRKGIVAYLSDAQRGMCPHCAESLTTPVGGFLRPVDACHVVGSGPQRRGFVVGNIYAGHSACNLDASRRVSTDTPLTAIHNGYRLTLSLADFLAPEVIQTEWPVSSVGGFRVYDPAYVA